MAAAAVAAAAAAAALDGGVVVRGGGSIETDATSIILFPSAGPPGSANRWKSSTRLSVARDSLAWETITRDEKRRCQADELLYRYAPLPTGHFLVPSRVSKLRALRHFSVRRSASIFSVDNKSLISQSTCIYIKKENKFSEITQIADRSEFN